MVQSSIPLQQNGFDEQCLILGCSVDDLVTLLECSPRADTACTLRGMRDAACQTSEPTTAGKIAADSEKRSEKRARATYRERQRLCVINDAFERLKEVVPSADGQMKKVDVLQMASQYIKEMTLLLEESSEI